MKIVINANTPAEAREQIVNYLRNQAACLNSNYRMAKGVRTKAEIALIQNRLVDEADTIERMIIQAKA